MYDIYQISKKINICILSVYQHSILYPFSDINCKPKYAFHKNSWIFLFQLLKMY